MTPHEIQEREREAKRILSEPLVQEAFDILEKGFIDAWKNSAVENTEAGEHLYGLLQCLDAFQQHFRSALEEGQIARNRFKIKHHRYEVDHG